MQSNFIEITLWHRCSPVNLLHIFRAPFSKNTCGWLLLYNYDPPGNGDCQFAALTYLLQRIGDHRSPSTLRAKVV